MNWPKFHNVFQNYSDRDSSDSSRCFW